MAGSASGKWASDRIVVVKLRRAQGGGSSGTPSAFSCAYVCSFISQPRPDRTSAHKVVRVFDAGSGPYEPDRRSVSRPSVASWRKLVRSPRSRTIASSMPRIAVAPPSHFLLLVEQPKAAGGFRGLSPSFPAGGVGAGADSPHGRRAVGHCLAVKRSAYRYIAMKTAAVTAAMNTYMITCQTHSRTRLLPTIPMRVAEDAPIDAGGIV